MKQQRSYEQLIVNMRDSLRYLSCDEIASIYNNMVDMDFSGLHKKVICKDSDDFGYTTFEEV